MNAFIDHSTTMSLSSTSSDVSSLVGNWSDSGFPSWDRQRLTEIASMLRVILNRSVLSFLAVCFVLTCVVSRSSLNFLFSVRIQTHMKPSHNNIESKILIAIVRPRQWNEKSTQYISIQYNTMQCRQCQMINKTRH